MVRSMTVSVARLTIQKAKATIIARQFRIYLSKNVKISNAVYTELDHFVHLFDKKVSGGQILLHCYISTLTTYHKGWVQ